MNVNVSRFIKCSINNNTDEINKEKNHLINELKTFESRKRELERAEKFTEPQAKIENINKKLSTLVEDNSNLSRSQLTKLRKSLEQEREEFLSVKYI